VDHEEDARQLIMAIEDLPSDKRRDLRETSALARNERAALKAAVVRMPNPLRPITLKLIESWESLTEAERVASLLLLREILVTRILEDSAQLSLQGV
jgi:hypothetical protein